MKHLIGWAFLIVVIILVLIGFMAEEPPIMAEGMEDTPAATDNQPGN
ncbi:hypothetical protein [Alcanivorax sp.]|jgi:hypothetical protein